MAIPSGYQVLLDPSLGLSGTSWTDQSGNSNSYTFNNTGYTYDPVIGSLLLPTSTIADANTINNFAFGTSAVSLVAWVKITETEPGDQFTIWVRGRTNNYQLQNFMVQWGTISAVAGLRLSILNVAGSRSSNSNAEIINYDTWYMLAYTKPSAGTVSSQKLYINGVEISSYATSGGTNVVNISDSNSPPGYNPRNRINENLGSGYPSNTPGYVGQLWGYNTELTSGEILDIYNDTVTRYYPPPSVMGGRIFGEGLNG
jgi:hypothetical protein